MSKTRTPKRRAPERAPLAAAPREPTAPAERASSAARGAGPPEAEAPISLATRIGAPVALAGLIAAASLPASKNGFVYDDFPLILDQRAPKTLADFVALLKLGHWNNLPYYRPISRLTLGMEKALFGDQPALYYLFNSALLIVAALIVHAILRLPAFGAPPVIAALAAGLFALHPVAAATTHPASAGPETLLFSVTLLGAVYAFLRGGLRWYAASIALFAMSLFSKEQAIVAPALFVLCDLTGMSADAPKRGSIGPWVKRHAPVALVVVSYFVLRSTFVASGARPRLAVLDRPEGPLLSLLYTLQSIFAPTVELVYEPRSKAIWLTEERQLAWLAIAVVIGLLVRKLWPAARSQALFWIGWFVLSVLPTANILVQETSFAERYVLFAHVGVAGLFGVLATKLWAEPANRAKVAVLGGGLLAVLTALHIHRGSFYRDDITFLKQWASTDPRAVQPLAFLGEDYSRRGQHEDAIDYYRQAIKADPPAAWYVHKPLGQALEAKGDLDGAVASYRRALDARPNDGQASSLLSNALRKRGEGGAASKQLEKQLDRDPTDVVARLNLGNVAADEGRPDEAIKHYEAALEKLPGSSLGRADRAEFQAKVHYNMGRVLAQQGRNDEAIQSYKKAISFSPEYAYAHTNLGLLLMGKNQLDEAIEHFRAALEKNPELTLAKGNLEKALKQKGQ